MLPWFLENPNPAKYTSDNYIVLDFETTNLDKGDPLNEQNKMVLACWRYKGKDYHRFASEFDMEPLLLAIEKSDFVVAHNAKFELQWLQRCGLDLHTVLVYDTMIGEYVLGGNRWKFYDLSLDKLGEKYGVGHKATTVSRLMAAGVCPSEIRKEWLLRYCQQDVALTEAIFQSQVSMLAEEDKLHLQYTRCLLTPVLADIEKNGMRLDADKVLAAEHAAKCEAETAERELLRFDPSVNWNSPQQVAAFLYDDMGFAEIKDKRRQPIRTESGKRKADMETIGRLKGRTARQKRFLDTYARYRAATTQLSKYLTKWKECVEENGGILDAEFNQCATYTHRLSSSGRKYKTQFQNFPRAYKHFFRAKKDGWLMGEADGSQLEFRVAVDVGNDAQGRQDIEDERDVHAFSAEIIFDAHAGDANFKAARTDAKAHTFKPLYGGTSGTKKEQAYYKFFSERYEGITGTQEGWVHQALNTKKVRLPWGMEFYFPNITVSSTGYVSDRRNIFNYPIQSFATAEIIPIAVVYFWHRSKDYMMQLVNTIHDSIITELPSEEVEIYEKLSRQALINDVYYYLDKVYSWQVSVPLGCEVAVSEYWSEGEEKKFQADIELYQQIAV